MWPHNGRSLAARLLLISTIIRLLSLARGHVLRLLIPMRGWGGWGIYGPHDLLTCRQAFAQCFEMRVRVDAWRS